MDDTDFNAKLRELIRMTVNLSPEQIKKLKPLIEETKPKQKTIKDSADQISDSFAELRICLKYVLFDLEATRRERDRLYRQLNRKSGQDILTK